MEFRSKSNLELLFFFFNLKVPLALGRFAWDELPCGSLILGKPPNQEFWVLMIPRSREYNLWKLSVALTQGNKPSGAQILCCHSSALSFHIYKKDRPGNYHFKYGEKLHSLFSHIRKSKRCRASAGKDRKLLIKRFFFTQEQRVINTERRNNRY